MRFFTPFISFYSVGVKNGTFLHQILDSANTPAIRQYMLCKPKRRKSCTHANKAIDIREEILDLITSTSRSARESELRPRIAKHLSRRVHPGVKTITYSAASQLSTKIQPDFSTSSCRILSLHPVMFVNSLHPQQLLPHYYSLSACTS